MADLLVAGPKEAPASTQNIRPPEGVNRPAWLPEKFKDGDELAKSYAELEKHLGKSQAPPEPEPAAPVVPPVQGDGTPPPETPPVAAPGADDFDKYSQEFAEKGALSPETYKALEAKGIPKKFVDAFIDGQKAKSSLDEHKVYQMAGGQETYAKMTEWASNNLSPAEIEAYNAAVSSGNEAQITFALNGVKARYEAKAGPARTLMGQGSTQQGLRPFATHEAMVAAMKDPRYGSSPEYRSEVMQRLSVSKF